MSWILGVEITTQSGEHKERGGEEKRDRPRVERRREAEQGNVPYGTGVGWSGASNSGVFTFDECLSELGLSEGEIVVDIDRGRLLSADADGTLLPTEDKKIENVDLPMLDRSCLGKRLEATLERHRRREEGKLKGKKKEGKKKEEEEFKEEDNGGDTSLEIFDREVRMCFSTCLACMIAG